jgi:hypothetical protein
VNQFWIFALNTTMHWGSGLFRWTLTLLGFETAIFERARSYPGSFNAHHHGNPDISAHGTCTDSTCLPGTPSQQCRLRMGFHDKQNRCSCSCRGTVRVHHVHFEDGNNWQPWPKFETIENCAKVLKKNLRSNTFSTILADDIPLSTLHISAAIDNSPEEFLLETFGFAIMSHNAQLIVDFLQTVNLKNIMQSGIYPLHLAISHLTNTKACLTLFADLVDAALAVDNAICKLYINHLEHTVLDTIMLTIVKSHSSCFPGIFDAALKKNYDLLAKR